MTPEEKAKQLYKIHYYATPPDPLQEGEDFKGAKQCAIITVNELIAETGCFFSDRKSYWKQVKREIDKL